MRQRRIAFLADQDLWEETVHSFVKSNAAVQSFIYEYLFRKLSGNGRLEEARTISLEFLKNIQDGKNMGQFGEQEGLIRFYLSCL